MNSVVNLKDGFITFNSNIDYSLSFSKCAIGYSNYNINSHERGSLVFLTNNNANTANISMNSDIRMCIASDGNVGIGINNPTSKLHIINSSTASNPDSGSVGLYIYNPINAVNQKSIITNRIAGSTSDKVMYSMDVSGSHGWSIFTKGNNTALRINNNWAGDGTDTLVIENNGNFGVGVNPSYRTHLKCNYSDISKGLHLDASDAVPSAPNQYALTIYPYIVGGGQVGWKFRTQSQTGGDTTPLTFDHTGNAYHPELLQIGSINAGAFNNIIRLRVYASDASGTAAIFKHPNDTKGIGIRFNEIFQTNANENINLTTSGTGVIVFNTNGEERMKINNLGNVGIGISPNYKLDVNGDVYVGNNSYYLSDHTGTASSQFFGKKYNNTILGGMEIENTTLGGNYSQKLHFHTHRYSGPFGKRMTINEVGDVGIGTENPQRRLHVQTAMRIGGSGPALDFGDDMNNQIYRNGTTNELRFTTSAIDRLTIDASGLATFGGILQVNGDIRSNGNITAYYSDERLKTITEYVSDVLPTLSKIRVFKYNCNDLAASYGYDKNKKEIGLSAQEIQKYYPEVVSIAPFDAKYDEETKELISKSGEKYLTLDYERLVPILLQGIKDLNNIVEKMQENEKNMKNEINNIKLILEKLEV